MLVRTTYDEQATPLEHVVHRLHVRVAPLGDIVHSTNGSERLGMIVIGPLTSLLSRCPLRHHGCRALPPVRYFAPELARRIVLSPL